MNKNEYDPNYIAEDVFARVGVKGVIFNQDGKFLILKRSEKSSQGGKWSLPGGGVDQGENPSVAIVREIIEETGLMVSDIKPYITNGYLNEKGDFVVMVGFTGHCEDGQVSLNWEHDEYRWLSKKEALSMDITEHAKFFIEAF